MAAMKIDFIVIYWITSDKQPNRPNGGLARNEIGRRNSFIY
jgi:hypothetical protein